MRLVSRRRYVSWLSSLGVSHYAFGVPLHIVHAIFEKMKNEWNLKAKAILKGELDKRSLTYKDLVLLLSDIGVIESYDSVESKMARCTFSAAFFIQALKAIGCKSVNL